MALFKLSGVAAVVVVFLADLEITMADPPNHLGGCLRFTLAIILAVACTSASEIAMLESDDVVARLPPPPMPRSTHAAITSHLRDLRIHLPFVAFPRHFRTQN